MEIKVEFESKKVSAFLDAAPQKTSIALLRALKRGGKSAATLAGRVVAKDMGLKVGTARKAIRERSPTGRTLTYEIRASLKRIPLIEFGAQDTRSRGVTSRLKGGQRRLPHAFITTLGGRRGVFQRKSTRRIPTEELFGPSIGRVMDKHRGEILARGEQQVMAELDRLLDRILRGG